MGTPASKGSEPLLLDPHLWVRYIDGTPGLKQDGISSIESARKTGAVFVSVISIWEVSLPVRKKRLALPSTVDWWVEQALRLPGVRLLALTPEIAIDSASFLTP